MKNNSILERQTIRLCVFLIALYGILTGLQQLFVIQWTSFESWIFRSIPPDWLAYSIMLLPVAIGFVLLFGKLKHKQKFIISSLAAMWVYQLGLAGFNLIAYHGQGTPWVPALCIGLMSVCFYAYYKKREEQDQDDLDKDLPL